MMLLFPPCSLFIDDEIFSRGYRLIFRTLRSPDKGIGWPRIDTSVWFVQYVLTITIGGILFLVFKDRWKSEDKQKIDKKINALIQQRLVMERKVPPENDIPF